MFQVCEVDFNDCEWEHADVISLFIQGISLGKRGTWLKGKIEEEHAMEKQRIFDLIAAEGPYPELKDKLMLYGQLVGSWDIAGTWYEQDGKSRKRNGEWHFTWMLGGRGVQDVLFAVDAPRDQYGITIRCYDAEQDIWHVSWMQPFGGEFVHLVGRGVGDTILQEGQGSDPHRRERWTFRDITSTSFLWQGEVSFDEGGTWFLEQEMHANRMKE